MLNLKKSLGQNLLIDKNILNKIAELSSINGKVVFEVGPGTGNLTEIILKKNPKKLLLVEKDKRFCQILSKKFDLEKNFIIYNEDILKFNFDKNINPDLVFGNLPYNISTQILAKFIKFNKWRPPFSKIIFMFQKEVGEKIIAKFGNKNYSRLSIITRSRLKV